MELDSIDFPASTPKQAPNKISHKDTAQGLASNAMPARESAEPLTIKADGLSSTGLQLPIGKAE